MRESRDFATRGVRISEQNVELVRRGYEVFNQGGPEAVISAGLWSPDLVFDFSRSEIAGLGVYRGYDEVRKFFEEDWFEAFPFEEWEVELDELVDHGDQVVAIQRQRGRGASSGVAAEIEHGMIFTLRNGLVVRAEIYGDPKKALEAAGLSDRHGDS
jgi:ketosteroid isomerase-like protein